MLLQPLRKKSIELVLLLKCLSRISYINVNSLDQLKQESCLRLLHISFDFLFLTKTQFISYIKYVRDRYFISSTPLSLPLLQCICNSSGLYLLVSASIRGRLLDYVKVMLLIIIFNIDSLSISSIYLQPSMSYKDITTTLWSIATSTVMIGNVNACLLQLEIQSRRLGLLERVEALSNFVRYYIFTAI